MIQVFQTPGNAFKALLTWAVLKLGCVQLFAVVILGHKLPQSFGERKVSLNTLDAVGNLGFVHLWGVRKACKDNSSMKRIQIRR